jgi:phospholipid N-methyltransferase
MTISATYDPADDKIRMRSTDRLDADTYTKVKAAGFGWAPKQECFFAVWNPTREDLALELAGEIGEEETTLAERAEVRAERFEEYHGKRAEESERTAEAVSKLADGIPLGQPILVGHHSEKRARKDAERIENGMRKAVNLWRTAEYWQRRARGVLSNVAYKERPDVRARRIKGLEADKRKMERTKDENGRFLRGWQRLTDLEAFKHKDGSPSTPLERAKYLANYDRIVVFSTWSKLDRGEMTPEAAQAEAIAAHIATIANCDRWLEHFTNRLSYERALLAASGFTPPAKKAGKAALPLLNIRGKVAYRDTFSSRGVVETETVSMTKAEFAKIHPDYKGTRVSADGTHRLRLAIDVHTRNEGRYMIVFLTDSKEHERPGQDAADARASVEQEEKRQTAEAYFARKREVKSNATPPRIAALAEGLKAGVQVAVAPNLFPTPPALARRMVEMANVGATDYVLEPSAGTGNIAEALAEACGGRIFVDIVEINFDLYKRLCALGYKGEWMDFLQRHPPFDPELRYHAVVMNPPFDHGIDIEHIKHAMQFLKAGGRLVGICANGPRQQAELKPLASTWEELPAGTFEGTGVRAVLLTIDK